MRIYLHKWIRQSRSTLCINTPHSTDRLSSGHSSPDPVKQEAPPSVPGERVVAHIRIPLHQKQCSVRDQVIEIEWASGVCN